MPVFKKPIEAREMITNPASEQLREMASKDEISTVVGTPVYHAKVVSRSAKFTEIIESMKAQE
jgi:hypothetical protein